MRIRHTSAVVFLGVALAICLAAVASEPDRPPPTVTDFTATRLLDRFDKDRDGKLNGAESQALREAFGGIDVPLLPAESFRYAGSVGSNYPGVSRLSPLDNTSPDNPLDDAVATLGRVLFYDKQLSQNDTIACASCHLQERAFADPRRFSLGFKGERTGRNAMGLGYARYTHIQGSHPGFFWDERAATLEDQVLMPIQDPVEMGMSLDKLEQKLQRLPYYPPLFAAAFRAPDVTSDRIAKAVAQFMRSMVSFDSKFDRAAHAAGDQDAAGDFADFNSAENLGKSLFINGVGDVAEIGCAHCHVPPTFGMPQSFNNGLDLHYADQGLGGRDVPSNDPFTRTNDGKFKASSLRNIALTAPYMHDGRFATLEQVVEHYSNGVHPHVNLGLAFNEDAGDTDKGTSGFRLTETQKSALVAFLKTLTDDELISAPRFSDPFVRLKKE